MLRIVKGTIEKERVLLDKNNTYKVNDIISHIELTVAGDKATEIYVHQINGKTNYITVYFENANRTYWLDSERISKLPKKYMAILDSLESTELETVETRKASDYFYFKTEIVREEETESMEAETAEPVEAEEEETEEDDYFNWDLFYRVKAKQDARLKAKLEEKAKREIKALQKLAVGSYYDDNEEEEAEQAGTREHLDFLYNRVCVECELYEEHEECNSLTASSYRGARNWTDRVKKILNYWSRWD